MLTILWGGLGVLGVLVLVLLLRLGHRAFRFRRLQPIVFEFLSLPNAVTALKYIERHPRLLSDDAEHFIGFLLDRAQARGDTDLLASGILHLRLLTQCREQGVEGARQALVRDAQTWMATEGPAWDRAVKIMEELVSEQEATIPVEELDEELADSLSHIMDLLRPLATEETEVTMDEILREVRRAVQQKAEGTLLPPSATSPPSTQARKRKRRRRRKRRRST